MPRDNKTTGMSRSVSHSRSVAVMHRLMFQQGYATGPNLAIEKACITYVAVNDQTAQAEVHCTCTGQAGPDNKDAVITHYSSRQNVGDTTGFTTTDEHG